MVLDIGCKDGGNETQVWHSKDRLNFIGFEVTEENSGCFRVSR